ncbi:MAG: hypothetical protein WA324_00565 [Bryobacteraceae bacterium]
MRETLGEFEARLQRIANDSAAEWQKARNAVMSFGDQKTFDGHRFYVLHQGGDPRFPALALEDVCLVMAKAGRAAIGVVPEFAVLFARRPPGPGDVFPDDPPIGREQWSATPAIDDGNFLWDLRRPGQAELLRLNGDELADEVAKGLADYYLRYQAANHF